MVHLVVCVFLCFVATVFGGHEKYEGHQLYRVSGSVADIEALEEHLDLLTVNPGSRSPSGKTEAIVRLSPEVRTTWLSYFDEKSMDYTKVADNLAEIFREEELQYTTAKEKAQLNGQTISFDTYYSHQEINDYLDELAVRYPNLVTLINAGLSFEGRQIKYVRISTSRFEDRLKPVIIIDGMMHGRDWVTTPVAIYLINQLVEDPESKLTTEIDWIIIPLANPDGYEYSRAEDRLWRKNRSTNPPGGEECPGVDPDRNFSFAFGSIESLFNPCSINYQGPFPYSDPESVVIRDAIISYQQRNAMYISLQSFGNMILYSWGHDGTLPYNGLGLHLIGVTMATAIDELALEEANRYIVGNSAQVLYYTSGTAQDFAKSWNVFFTYTMKLPGYEYGFLVPPTYIKQVVTETFAGIAAGGEYISDIWINP